MYTINIALAFKSMNYNDLSSLIICLFIVSYQFIIYKELRLTHIPQ
jgi:hypothetical protein